MLNRLLGHLRLPSCAVAPYRVVIATVLWGQYMAQWDLAAYFFNFTLEEEARDRFRFRAGHGSGAVLRMVRLAMGFSASPQAGQAVSTRLTLAARQQAQALETTRSIVWLDNVVVSGGLRDLARVDATLRTLFQTYGLTLGETEPPARGGTALGLQFDLEHRQWRMDPKWVDKVRGGVAGLSLTGNMPLRVWWRIAGLIVWRRHATLAPLFQLADILRWMSATARECPEELLGSKLFWDRAVCPPEAARTAIRRELQALYQNDWQPWRPTPQREVHAHTDASLSAWAYTEEGASPAHSGDADRPTAAWGHFPESFSRGRLALIDSKELYALCRYVQRKATGPPVHLRVGVDNTTVIGVWRRCYSATAELLEQVIDLYKTLERWGGRLSVYYVSTSDNRADKYTRIKPPHPFYEPL
eukprot:TRINITY_DN11867_c0_g1_i1.p1 TRINITY_DN11867_c0_g1~~TRINITY_DN11867_c0_g1_i1.p1  ORF type:complete len:415 (+),score=2.49 TRINITY_DN11867_c0_g1_i1:393-1637(+)